MDFARSTNMSVGDKCVFKFITSEDKLCLAKITKASPTEVADDDVEVDSGMDDKDADKDVELVNGVDDGDPFFVVTITTTAMLVRFMITLCFFLKILMYKECVSIVLKRVYACLYLLYNKL